METTAEGGRLTEVTVARLGIWEDKRPLSSSGFRVGPLSADAEWNWVTSVLMAFSRSEYWGEEMERINGKLKKMLNMSTYDKTYYE